MEMHLKSYLKSYIQNNFIHILCKQTGFYYETLKVYYGIKIRVQQSSGFYFEVVYCYVSVHYPFVVFRLIF